MPNLNGLEPEDIMLRNQELQIKLNQLEAAVQELLAKNSELANSVYVLEKQYGVVLEQRDEARRLACENEAAHNGMMFDNPKYSDPIAVMREHGWDCFKEEG